MVGIKSPVINRDNKNLEKAGHAGVMIHDYLAEIAVLPNPPNADWLIICPRHYTLSCKIRCLIRWRESFFRR
jgi:hypothetical protein